MNGCAGYPAEGLDDDDITVAEGCLFVGQIEVAERLCPDGHRHTEECAHLRVIWWETDRVFVGCDRIEDDRLVFSDHSAQHAASRRRASYGAGLSVADPGVDELG